VELYWIQRNISDNMNKMRLNYFVDIVLIICFIILLVSVALGVRRSAEFHGTFGGLLILLIMIHIILHWSTLICMTKSIFKNKQ